MVLDLDETLIHCSVGRSWDADHVVEIEVGAGVKKECSLFVRPYARRLLEEVSSVCEVVVFTASSAVYADKILNYLDP